jgi:hypothetical protein
MDGRSAVIKARDIEGGRRNERHKRRISSASRGCWKENILCAPVTVRGDTRNSIPAGGRRCSASVPMPVGGLWNECWRGRGVGGNVTPVGDDLSGI